MFPLYYINLNRSTERNGDFISQMSDPTIAPYFEYKRIEAYDGTDPETIRFINRQHIRKHSNKREVACTISHLKAIYQAYQDGQEYAFISEDDTIFAPTFDRNFPYFKSLIELYKDSFDLIQCVSCSVDRTIYTGQELVLDWKPRYYCTNLYFLSRKAMEILIKKHIVTRNPHEIKFVIHDVIPLAEKVLYMNPKIRTVTSNLPMVTYPCDFKSTIHTSHNSLHQLGMNRINKRNKQYQISQCERNEGSKKMKWIYRREIERISSTETTIPIICFVKGDNPISLPQLYKVIQKTYPDNDTIFVMDETCHADPVPGESYPFHILQAPSSYAYPYIMEYCLSMLPTNITINETIYITNANSLFSFECCLHTMKKRMNESNHQPLQLPIKSERLVSISPNQSSFMILSRDLIRHLANLYIGREEGMGWKDDLRWMEGSLCWMA